MNWFLNLVYGSVFLMAQVLDNFLDERDWTYVEKDEYRISSSEVLGVDCLGTCLGVAVFDPKTDQGYLLHAGTLENEDLEDQVNEFLGEIEDIEDPYEVLVGGTMSSKYNPLSKEKFTESARDIVEDALEEKGVQYEASWNEPPIYNRLVVSPDYGILYDNPEQNDMDGF